MNWIEIFEKIIEYTGCSLITAIIIIIGYLFIKYVGNLLTHKIDKKIEIEYEKKLEEFKSENEKKIKELESELSRRSSINKLYDSTIFQAYNEIRKALINARTSIEVSIIYYETDKDKRFIQESANFNDARNKYNIAFQTFHLNSLLISPNIRNEIESYMSNLQNTMTSFRDERLNINYKNENSYFIYKKMNTKLSYDDFAMEYIKNFREDSNKIQALILKEFNLDK